MELIIQIILKIEHMKQNILFQIEDYYLIYQ